MGRTDEGIRAGLARARKAIVAAATLVVEVVAVWQGAPEWALVAAAAAGAVLVWAIPNAGQRPALPHLSADELLELADRAARRESDL